MDSTVLILLLVAWFAVNVAIVAFVLARMRTRQSRELGRPGARHLT